jgi:hypothetical protein
MRCRRKPNFSIRLAGYSVFIAAVGVVPGCRWQRGPDVQFVEGIVRLDGSPLDDATVTFFPIGDVGLGAAGLTGRDGRYTLNSPRARLRGGALAGDYAITVTKYEEARDTFRVPAPDPAADPQAFAKWQESFDEHVQRSANKPPRLLTPKGYSETKTSGLTATVKPGKNRIDFELKSDFKGVGGK